MKKLIYLIALAAVVTSCNMPDKSAGMKSAAIKERTQQFYDQVLNAHNPEAVDAFCTADFVDHNPDPGHSGKGTDDLKASLKEFFIAFPDIHATPHFMIAEGDTVAIHLTMDGTNSGPMSGMPASNKRMSIDGIDIIVIKGDKASERWGLFDMMTWMKQMGDGAMGSAPADTSKKM